MASEIEMFIDRFPPSIQRLLKSIRSVDMDSERTKLRVAIPRSEDLVDEYGGVHGAIVVSLSIAVSELLALMHAPPETRIVTLNSYMLFERYPTEWSSLEIEANISTRTSISMIVDVVCRADEYVIARGSIVYALIPSAYAQ